MVIPYHHFMVKEAERKIRSKWNRESSQNECCFIGIISFSVSFLELIVAPWWVYLWLLLADTEREWAWEARYEMDPIKGIKGQTEKNNMFDYRGTTLSAKKNYSDIIGKLTIVV